MAGVEMKSKLNVLCVRLSVSYRGGWINVCCIVVLKGYFGLTI